MEKLSEHPHKPQRFACQAGIAIGPILFVVAILAILATAIAAGSSTFATNASSETNRTYAGSILQMGRDLKLGTDKVIASTGIDLINVDMNDQNTSSNASIFSPSGGGVISPSTALAATPATDRWVMTWGNVANMGNATLPERLALLKVNQGVCDQINILGSNSVTDPVGTDFTVTVSNTQNFTGTIWPASLRGRISGCIHAITTNPGYFFYQVLAVQ